MFALSRLTFSGRIELTRVNPQLFQDRSAEIGADLARNRGYPSTIFDTCVASLALCFVDYDNRICLPRKLAELANKIVLIRQRCKLSAGTISYLSVRMSRDEIWDHGPEASRDAPHFENTNKPLRDWFKLAHLMLASKERISARQLWRYMGFGSLKTAWSRRLRSALIEKNMDKLGGIVEVDEGFVGG